MSHPLHEAVGDYFRKNISSSFNAELDFACDPNFMQQLPLFINHSKNRISQVAKVDLSIIENSSKQVKLICEIEESGFNPTKIYGKVFTSANAVMGSTKSYQFTTAKEGIFIQILSKRGYPKNTKKILQGMMFETSINMLLRSMNSWIKDYYLLYSDYIGSASPYSLDANSKNRLDTILKLHNLHL